MSPAFMVHANRPLAFNLYDFHLNGVPVEKLAAAYALPVHSVEEKIGASKALSEVSGQGFARPVLPSASGLPLT
jgi:hypothetical protein